MKITELVESLKRIGPDMSDPYEQGWFASYDDHNPYEKGTEEHQQWQNGRDEREAQPNHYDESVDHDLAEEVIESRYDDSMTDAEWEREYQREKLEKELARKEIEKNHKSQFKTKEEAIQYANDKLKTFLSTKTGMSVYAMPDGGFDVVSTARTAAAEKRRKLISDAGGKHLGTLGPRYTKHKMKEQRDPWKEKYFGPTTRAIQKIFRVKTDDKSYKVRAETEQQAKDLVEKHAPGSNIVSVKFVSNIMSEGTGYNSQYKSKDAAIQYAKDKVKTFRDWEDGIEIWALPDGGFDVVHTMNSNGRDHVIKNGGKKLGTIYPEKPSYLKKKDVTEASSTAQQAAIAISMKKAGKKPKDVEEAVTAKDAGGYTEFKGIDKEILRNLKPNTRKHPTNEKPKTNETSNYGDLDEVAPPGEEKLVRKLKKEYPGHPEKAFATAWSIYNKKHGKK